MKKFHEITLSEDSSFYTKNGVKVLKKGQIVRFYEEDGEEEEEDEDEDEEMEEKGKKKK